MPETGCVVVGAGLAAAKAIEGLRDGGFDESITLIGDENVRPYERPPLSKEYLQGNSEIDDAYVHAPDWYAEHDVESRFGVAATGLNTDARTVTLDDGGEVSYGRLVLATGASPRRLDLPGADLAGVHTLRRIEDSDALKAAFGSGIRVAVIGAGWIGLEVASAARTAGCEVTVLEMAPHPLYGVLGEQLARYFARVHRDHGVDLRTGVTVQELTGTGSVEGVRTGDGVVPADLVVVGVGVTPNSGLASDAGLAVDNGIVVDERLRTADESVWAIGDVANAYNTGLGERIRVEHWDNAIRQGELAARTILGQDGRYDWQPFFFTDQFDLGMEYVGRGGPDDDVVLRGELDGGEFIAFWLRDGRVRAGMNVNVWDVNDDLRALIGREIDPARLADSGVALSDL